MTYFPSVRNKFKTLREERRKEKEKGNSGRCCELHTIYTVVSTLWCALWNDFAEMISHPLWVMSTWIIGCMGGAYLCTRNMPAVFVPASGGRIDVFATGLRLVVLLSLSAFSGFLTWCSPLLLLVLSLAAVGLSPAIVGIYLATTS